MLNFVVCKEEKYWWAFVAYNLSFFLHTHKFLFKMQDQPTTKTKTFKKPELCTFSLKKNLFEIPTRYDLNFFKKFIEKI